MQNETNRLHQSRGNKLSAKEILKYAELCESLNRFEVSSLFAKYVDRIKLYVVAEYSEWTVRIH